MTNKYEDWLVSGGDFPGLDINEVELPDRDYLEPEDNTYYPLDYTTHDDGIDV